LNPPGHIDEEKLLSRYEEGWLAALDELASYSSREDCSALLKLAGVTAAGYERCQDGV
jgi:hypothetical protein